MKYLLFTLLSMVFVIANAQTNWYEIPTGVDNKLNTIDFPSENVGYIGGNDTLLLKTTDGGENWNQLTFSGVTTFPGGVDLLDINFINENIGYMTVGPYGKTFKTIDGGLNWEEVVNGGMCYNQSNFFFSEDNGFIGGSGCFTGEEINIISNGPADFADLSTNGSGGQSMITQIDFLKNDFGLASSTGGRIFRTTDGGQNWDSIPSGLGNLTPITSVKIIDDTLAYAGYIGGFSLLISIDGGLSWSQDNSSGSFFYPDFYEIIETQSNRIYAAGVPSFGNTGLILEESDNFWNFWEVDQEIYAMDSYSDSVVWAVGDSGYVVVNVPPTTLGVPTKTNEYKVQVFPNPFIAQLNIEVSGFIEPSVTIFNLQGRIVASSKKITDAVLELGHLKKGVYLLVLEEGNRIEQLRVVKE